MNLDEQVAELTERVVELERRLAAMAVVVPPARPPTAPWLQPPQLPPPLVGSAGPAPAPASVSASVTGAPSLGPPPPGQLPPAPVPSPRPAWLNTETLLLWAGLLLVVLAAIFFVATAISRGWIGPELQLLGATAIGVALLVGAVRLAPERRFWASAFGVGGAVVVPTCAAAAHAGLDLIGPYPALVLLALVTVAVVALSWRLLMEEMAAVVGLGAAVLVAWVAAEAELPPLVPGGWLVALAIAFSFWGWLRQWVVARVTVVGLVGLELLILLADPPELGTPGRVVAVIGTLLVGLVGWFGPLVSARRRGAAQGWHTALDLRLVALVPLWTWAATSAIVAYETRAAFVAAGLVGVAAGAALLAGTWGRVDRTIIASYLWAIATLALVVVGVATNGPGLLVVLAAVAAGGVVLGRWFDDLFGTVYSLCLAIAAVLWAMVLLLAGLADPMPWADLGAAAFVIVLVGAGAFAVERWTGAAQSLPLTITAWVGALGWAAAAFVHGPQGQVVVSLIWAAAAISALLWGVTANRGLYRGLGLVTLTLVLGKLLTVDLGSVDALWRVGLFLVVGAGLMRLGYLLPKLSARATSQLP